MVLLGAASCKKLPRDNPLDEHNDANTIDGIALVFSKSEVIYDNNQDGIINQNETVYLKVYLKNNGTSNANGVKATISSASNYISNLVPSAAVSYNSGSTSSVIYPGGEKFGDYGSDPNYNDYTVRFKVAAGSPAGTEITFNMHITDEEGNEWEDAFTIQVMAR